MHGNLLQLLKYLYSFVYLKVIKTGVPEPPDIDGYIPKNAKYKHILYGISKTIDDIPINPTDFIWTITVKNKQKLKNCLLTFTN